MNSSGKSNPSRNSKTTPSTFMAKVIVIGNSSVGKTSILSRYTWNGQGTYQLSHTPTIGVDFKTKTINLPSATLKLQLWDTAGQQRFRTMTANYYTGTSGVVLVYSVTDRKSFEEISEWMYQINNKNDENTPKIILANKCDAGGRNNTGDEKRVVDTYEGRLLADKYKAMFMEVSAKENINIEEAFTMLANKMLENFVLAPNKVSNGVLVLDGPRQGDTKEGKSSCC